MNNRVPMSIVTGFLGSGKTTLLNALLRDSALSGTAVIVNEFGEIGIDHLLVEHVDEGVIELSDGCLCCTMRGSLIDTLVDLLERYRIKDGIKLKRVIIETTGLADPAPILQAVLAHPVLIQSFELAGVITTVDVVHVLDSLQNYAEIQKQIAFADRLVLTKSDLLDDMNRQNTIIHQLSVLNPVAEIVVNNQVHVRDLIECGVFQLTSKACVDRHKIATDQANQPAFRVAKDQSHGATCYMHDDENDSCYSHHDHKPHHSAIKSFSLLYDQPICYASIDAFLDLLRGMHGAAILRIKAVVHLCEEPDKPLIIHGVQGFFHPPVTLDAWPEGKRQTRLVIIANGVDESEVQRLFDAFLNIPSADTADRTALADNPLAIPGMKF